MMATTELMSLEEVDRRHILRVIEHCQGNRTNAAQMLEIDRKTLYRKLRQWEGRADDPTQAGDPPPDDGPAV